MTLMSATRATKVLDKAGQLWYNTIVTAHGGGLLYLKHTTVGTVAILNIAIIASRLGLCGPGAGFFVLRIPGRLGVMAHWTGLE